MNTFFEERFSRLPVEVVEGDYYYHTDDEGDPFDENDEQSFISGNFHNNWTNRSTTNTGIFGEFREDILSAFAQKQSPFLDIACGPGMGIAPIILSKYPDTPCLATDASSRVIRSWRKYIDDNLTNYNINLASFSALEIPLCSNSMDVVTSFAGISSTRNGSEGKMKALSEVYRVLREGGYYIGIECEWMDYDAIEQTFALWGQPVWDAMKKEPSWEERFSACGFTTVSNEHSTYWNLADNELAEVAAKFGINIAQKQTLYVMKK